MPGRMPHLFIDQVRGRFPVFCLFHPWYGKFIPVPFQELPAAFAGLLFPTSSTKGAEHRYHTIVVKSARSRAYASDLPVVPSDIVVLFLFHSACTNTCALLVAARNQKGSLAKPVSALLPLDISSNQPCLMAPGHGQLGFVGSRVLTSSSLHSNALIPSALEGAARPVLK